MAIICVKTRESVRRLPFFVTQEVFTSSQFLAKIKTAHLDVWISEYHDLFPRDVSLLWERHNVWVKPSGEASRGRKQIPVDRSHALIIRPL